MPKETRVTWLHPLIRRQSPARLTTIGLCLAVWIAYPASFVPDVARAQAGTPPFLLALPDHYISGFAAKAKECQDENFSHTWIEWNSYVIARVGARWSVVSSNPTNCKLALSTSDTLIRRLPFGDGSGFTKLDWQGYALSVGLGVQDHPIGHNVPSGWKCFALPSWWGADAWSFARLAHKGAPADDEFAVAAGITAGAGYCVSGGKRTKNRMWKGSKFFAWSPRPGVGTQTCWDLKEIPDPQDPNNKIPIASYANAKVFGDYDKLPC
jgi:hypothetical protein